MNMMVCVKQVIDPEAPLASFKVDATNKMVTLPPSISPVIDPYAEYAVGASRPPCDNGWVPAGYQIGLTGKIIAPDLYIAVAISGASQHITGCSGARTIVAINKDPEANIFREASFGVVGDWTKLLPALTAKVKELVAD